MEKREEGSGSWAPSGFGLFLVCAFIVFVFSLIGYRIVY